MFRGELMANFTVKQIPDDLYERLKASARRRHRSINGEIIACIDESLRSRRVPIEEVVGRARRVRAGMRHQLSLEEIVSARDAGRS